MIFSPHRPGAFSEFADELPAVRFLGAGSSAGGNPLVRFLREFFLLDAIDLALILVVKF